MRIKQMFATVSVGAVVTTGLVLGASPASADPPISIVCQPGYINGCTGPLERPVCDQIEKYFSNGNLIGYTRTRWYEGRRADVPGTRCTTYSSGGRIQGTSCKVRQNA